MKIKVTEDHIRNGTRRNPISCPIACAVKEQHPIAVEQGWRICSSEIERLSHDIASIDLPQEAKEFIDDFDNERPVQPFEFEICLGAKPKEQ